MIIVVVVYGKAAVWWNLERVWYSKYSSGEGRGFEVGLDGLRLANGFQKCLANLQAGCIPQNLFRKITAPVRQGRAGQLDGGSRAGCRVIK